MKPIYTRREFDNKMEEKEYRTYVECLIRDVNQRLFEREKNDGIAAEHVRELEAKVGELERGIDALMREIEDCRADLYKLISRLGRLGDP